MGKRAMLFCAGVLLSCQSETSDNGQTGSPGIGCDTCRDSAARIVEEYNHPPPLPTFTGSECVADELYGTHCRCLTSSGALELSRNSSCLGARLRGGFCVTPDEPPTCCDPLAAGSCEALCGSVEQRLQEDAAKPSTAELFYGPSCDFASARFCAYVIKIDDRCYLADASGHLAESAYDCTLGGEVIASMPAPVLDTSVGGCRSTTATGGAFAATGGASGAGSR